MTLETAQPVSDAARLPTGGQSVLILAQLPPPVHGVTATTERVQRLLDGLDGTRVETLWAGSAQSLTDVDSRSLGKLAAFAGLNLGLARRWLAGQRFDIVYLTFVPWTHAALRDGIVAWWGQRLGRRTLVHLHGEGLADMVDGASAKAKLLRWLLRGSELIAITGPSADIARRSGLFSRVLPLANVAADPGTPDMTAGTGLRLGFLGNLDPRKGVLRFVETVAHLANAGLDVSGRIAGGSTRHLTVEALRDHVRASGLADRIEVVGPVHGSAKAAFLCDVDVLVYLSAHDHAPLVVIEALSYGIVPVVLDTGGVAEMVSPDFAAHVLPDGLPLRDRGARIEAVLRPYATDRRRLAADRQRARALYLQRYTETQFKARWRDIMGAGPASAATAGARTSPLVEVRSPLPPKFKKPAFAVARSLHAKLAAKPLPDRIAVYFHALEPADRDALVDCVEALRGQGYRSVSMDDYLDPATPGKVFNISFDDNYRSWHAALDLFDRLQLKATFFTNSLPFRDDCSPLDLDLYFDRIDHAGERKTLSRAEFREIAARGHEIGGHGHSHQILASLPKEQWEVEIRGCKAILEELSGRPVHHFSWPYGMPRHITDELRAYCLASGFRSLAAATPGMLHVQPCDPRDVQRAPWRTERSVADNLADLAIDGAWFTRLTGRSAVG